MTLLYSTGTLTVPISLLYSLLAHWQALYHPIFLFWRNSSPYVTLFSHLAQWQSLYYSTTLYLPTDRLHINLTILYWPTDGPFITLLAHWQSLYHSTILNRPTDIPYINQQLSTGPLAVPISLYLSAIGNTSVPAECSRVI